MSLLGIMAGVTSIANAMGKFATDNFVPVMQEGLNNVEDSFNSMPHNNPSSPEYIDTGKSTSANPGSANTGSVNTVPTFPSSGSSSSVVVPPHSAESGSLLDKEDKEVPDLEDIDMATLDRLMDPLYFQYLANSAFLKQNQEYNQQEAQAQRAWAERMSNTSYQRAVTDMKKAGLNPYMLYSNGGSGAGVPSGSSASSTGTSVSGSTSLLSDIIRAVAGISSSALSTLSKLLI